LIFSPDARQWVKTEVLQTSNKGESAFLFERFFSTPEALFILASFQNKQLKAGKIYPFSP
jgi:hypothetical protein